MFHTNQGAPVNIVTKFYVPYKPVKVKRIKQSHYKPRQALRVPGG
jgi:hypothetical protein